MAPAATACDAVTRLMRRLDGVPVVKVASVFWYTLLTEGLSGLKPRWGALTFAFLNDGFAPTPWHTWYVLTHSQDAPYAGCWPDGAPRSAAEAQRRLVRWEESEDGYMGVVQ